ncbi:hypothetical protein PGT21_021908 [Puccinia graminis f. sp. tritici]|uniref:Uncharacterized protein n=1 Tax=Puccinia graminis f. sp. tritici TaxID=56615 RepID=A0A5B0NZ32_PUCGR|nr:hypothetical protein PGT21_021908 [Puccinia graminis f. sp. tritici]
MTWSANHNHTLLSACSVYAGGVTTGVLPHIKTSNINSSNSNNSTNNSTKKNITTSLNRGQQHSSSPLCFPPSLTTPCNDKHLDHHHHHHHHHQKWKRKKKKQDKQQQQQVNSQDSSSPPTPPPPSTSPGLQLPGPVFLSLSTNHEQSSFSSLNSRNPVPLSLRSHRPPQGTCKLYTRISSSGSD